MRLKKRMKERSESKEKPEYEEQSAIHHFKDNRYTTSKEPIWREDKLEKRKHQPDMRSHTSEKEMRSMETNAHGDVEKFGQPDQHALEKGDATTILSKDKRKKMASMIISKKMNKKKEY